MTAWVPWKIALKDFKVLRRKKSVFYTLIGFPLAIGVLFPTLALLLTGTHSVKNYSLLVPYINSFSFFFVLLPPILANGLASYSIVGEKLEKTLESLLSSPTSDGEILLGKSLASFVPVMLSVWCGSIVFMTYLDVISYQQLGYLLYPNWTLGALLLVATPLACLISVEWSVVISARVSDLRGAQQLGGLGGVLPFLILFALLGSGTIKLDSISLLAIGGTLLLIDVVLYYVSVASFRREEILTKWK